MNITVTGANGFLGSHMCSLLKVKGHTVIPVKNVDLRIKSEAEKAIPECDLIMHFAADMGGVGYFSKYQYHPFINNMQIDINLMELCTKKSIPRLFYPSSACVYPTYEMKMKNNKLTENLLSQPALPDQMYGWEKYVITKLSQYTSFEMRVGILHTIYGEGQAWDGEKSKFPPAVTAKVIRNKKYGDPIVIWGNGTQRRTFLYISDAVEMIYEIAISKHYSGPVNVSSIEDVSVKECVKMLMEYAEITDSVSYDVSKPSGAKFRGADMSKYLKNYTYRQKVSIKEGFIKLYNWMFDKVAKS